MMQMNFIDYKKILENKNEFIELIWNFYNKNEIYIRLKPKSIYKILKYRIKMNFIE